MDFLNKLYTKAVFTNAPELNVGAYDLGEDMISATLDDELVQRIPTATGTVGSLAIICGATVTISVLKTSTAISEYQNRILKNGYIGGTLTIYTDVNTPLTMKDVSINMPDLGQLNGTQAHVNFEIKGNIEVNSEALKM